MKKYLVIRSGARIFHATFLFLLAAALFLTCASPAAAQKEKKKKKDNTLHGRFQHDDSLPDEQQIDTHFLKCWGPGRLATSRSAQGLCRRCLHRNGSWAAPDHRLEQLLAIYQQQRRACSRCGWTARYVHQVSGTVAWACYQWICRHRRWTAKLIAGAYHVVLEKRTTAGYRA